MKKMVVLALCAMFAAVIFSGSSLAADAEFLEGEELFTRSNLKAKGRIVFFHNMSKSKGFIPVGTAVLITSVGKQSIRFEIIETGERYTLKALSDQYSRYFVKDLNEIGLKNISSKIKRDVENMGVVRGMTKNEVYISRGCPAFIAWGVKSWFSTLGDIMSSNTWYYNAGTSKIEMLVIFENGVVKEVTSEINKA